MSRTRVLIAVLLLVMLLQLFPQRSALIKEVWVGAGALYVALWGAARYWVHRQRQAAHQAQLAADERDYRDYKAALDVIRATYDSQRGSDDPTSIAPDYREALSVLHDRHQAMLDRKFGPRP